VIALHGLWSSAETLCVWGEDGARHAPLRRRGGRPAKVPRTRPHPFALDASALRAGLAGLGPDPAGLGVGTVTLLLPSAPTGPQPSPHLMLDTPAPAEGLGLCPWELPALIATPEQAIDLLVSLPVQPPSGGGVGVGHSLSFLATIANLALATVAAGQVLPALAGAADHGLAGRWQPVLATPEARERIALLTSGMPAVCRAEPVGGSPAGRPPSEVVASMLARLVDAAARRSLGPAGVGVKGRGPAGAAAARAWMKALGAGDGALPAATLRRQGPQLAALRKRLEVWSRPALAPAASGLRTCFRLSAPPAPGPSDDAGEAEGPEGTSPDRNAGPRPRAGGTGPTRGHGDKGGGHGDKGGGNGGGNGQLSGAGPWRLEFLLQSTQDRSMIVPASRVWSSGKRIDWAGGDDRADDPAETLLAGLGRASRLYPPLKPALRTARPEACDLDTAEAYGFLAEATPMLEQAGFGVFVPPWWSKRSARLGAKLTVRPKQEGGTGAPSLLGVDGICAYEWQVAVGEETLSLAELERLAALKAPLVAVRGQWVELRAEEVAAALRFFRSPARTGEMRLVDAMAIGLGARPGDTGLPVVGVAAEGTLADLMNPDAGSGGRRYREVAVPGGLAATLRPYQHRGLSWLAFHDGLGLGACLADDMGLGKTIQLLSLLLAEREQPPAVGNGAARRGGRAAGSKRRGARPQPTLLVCPMSLVSNWEREAARFAPALAVHVHHGTERLTGARFATTARKADLVLTTYALATRDRDLLAGVPWRRVVLDEAQNIKNRNARQTRAIVSIPAERRVALTGTPVENRLSDLWSIMDFLNPGLLGDAKEFRTRFALPVERFGDEDAARRLKRLTGPFILRRLKTDRAIIADLPDKVEMKVFCNLTREQATLYQAVVDDMLERIEASEGIERKGLVLATMVKLKQVCNHPAHMLGDRSPLPGRSGKLARLEEILEEVLAEGEKALVFTQFAELGALLKPHLQERLGSEVSFLHGGTTKKTRDELVAGFQSAGGPGVFLLSLKAGGTGLNLTAANHVVHFDRWWNPAVENQATDRAFRIGQRRNVQVRKFVCAGTLEERIDQMIERKKALAERIVGTGEAWLTELSTDQLRELITLSADAVSEG
jgi:hypothetical protein